MNYFQHRRWRKTVKHALHEARYRRHMKLDVAESADLAAAEQAERELVEALKRRDEAGLELALQALDERVGKISPPSPHHKMRENVEVIAVALAVAMGFRAYFIQPFKIPTGSMQPTLNGIIADADTEKSLLDVWPLNLPKRFVLGERLVEVKAPATGRIYSMTMAEDPGVVLRQISKLPKPLRIFERIYHWILGDLPSGAVRVYLVGGTVTGDRIVGGSVVFVAERMKHYFSDGDQVMKGQKLAAGRIHAGDHIFVNKVLYNFRRPRRGDIFVFSTRDVEYPGVRKDNYYIKRLVGLPNESIGVEPPYLVVDGKHVTEPFPFKRLVEARDQGYNGYDLPDAHAGGRPALAPQNQPLKLSATQYLPMGDNTRSSLDGRYFGPVERERIVGPAFVVYWPFGRHWGRVQ